MRSEEQKWVLVFRTPANCHRKTVLKALAEFMKAKGFRADSVRHVLPGATVKIVSPFPPGEVTELPGDPGDGNDTATKDHDHE